jgi:NAD+ synthase
MSYVAPFRPPVYDGGMTNTLSITFAQLSQRVGDLAANADAMLAARENAVLAALKAAGEVDLIVFPEMQLIGYPAEDLIQKPALAVRAEAELERMARATADGGPAILLGTLKREGDRLYNAVVLLDGGEIVAERYKHELPNYGTFDEKRHFSAGPLPEPILFKGVKIGVPICEDVWFPDVCRNLKALGAELLISPNGSPYEIDKDDYRSSVVVGARVAETGLPLAYLNRVGGQDELTFDGASFILNGDGSTAHQVPDWEEHVVTTHWTRTPSGWICAPGGIAPLETNPADVYHAMMIGLRDYVNANRFPGVILGLSGGIDSAICAAIAADALGPDRVWCVMMPSPYTSQASLDDAAGCAKMIGCRLDTVPIANAMEAFDGMLEGLFEGRAPDTTEENIQSRIRGLTLMALSNKFGPMLVTTGNKSEMSVGYATIYGDMAGGYNPIKDAYKMTVFGLCKWRNANKPRLGLGPDGPVMPESVITKPPSAELRDNQKDSDSLPDYPILDPILMGLVEDELSVDEVAARGFDRAVVARIEKLLCIAEYKRRQAPPGVKLGKKNFGRDRRYPITNAFRTS